MDMTAARELMSQESWTVIIGSGHFGQRHWASLDREEAKQVGVKTSDVTQEAHQRWRHTDGARNLNLGPDAAT